MLTQILDCEEYYTDTVSTYLSLLRGPRSIYKSEYRFTLGVF